MQKQLIVVTHGVGVREAGVSTALLSAALISEAGPSAFRPHSSDDFTLHEPAIYGKGSIRAAFEARLRRFRSPEKDAEGPLKERVIADFYWGDISGTGTTPIRVVWGFFKIVLGLSHAIRENAYSVFSGPSQGDRFWRWLAETAALTIHGPIFALNVLLLAGYGLLIGIGLAAGAFDLVPWLFAPDQVPLWTAGLAAFAGFWMLRRAEVFLTRNFAGWLVVSAALLALSWLIEVSGWTVFGVLPALDEVGKQINCAWTKDSVLACKAGFSGPFLHALRLSSLMVLCWVVVLFAAMALGVAGWRQRLHHPDRALHSFAMQALALMSAMWILVLAAVWGSVLKLPVPDVAGAASAQATILVASVLRALIPSLFLLGLVGLASYVAARAARKAFANNRPPAEYLNGDADTVAEHARLIVGKWGLAILAALFPVMLLVMAGSFLAAYHQSGWAEWLVGATRLTTIKAARDGLLAENSRFLLTLAAGVGLALALAPMQIARGVAIFTDILTYLNDYSWCSRRPVAWDGQGRVTQRHGTGSRSFVERLLGLRSAEVAGQPVGYWPRARIKDRLAVLIEQLIKDEVPDQLVLVSHSQGTVIAIDLIDERGVSWRQARNGRMSLALITMGSPYRHLYMTYFPDSFAAPRRRGTALQPASHGGQLLYWSNIFRIDDFVGTHIDSAFHLAPGAAPPLYQWPQECPVAANGHTNYWTDANVIPLLRDRLAF
jgi:hypothetical protein